MSMKSSVSLVDNSEQVVTICSGFCMDVLHVFTDIYVHLFFGSG